jgi:uncharacterized cupredoxin-like copper-binding protein
MRRFSVIASAALLALVLVGSACTSNSSGSDAGTADAAVADTAAASFDVSLSDELKIDPAMIDAPSNTPLTFNVTNTGQGQHSFAIEAGDQTYQTPLLDGGATATLDVPALPAGDFTTLCTVPGHADAGMKGMLMVSDTGAERPTPVAHRPP